MSMNENLTVVDAIQRHRSIRRYRPDPVPDDLLQTDS